ncbi:MAG: hypothetical protein ACYTGX_00135, partial [Planctomycetota bacterium]
MIARALVVAACLGGAAAAAVAAAGEEPVVPPAEKVAVFRIAVRGAAPEAKIGALSRLVVEPHADMVRPVSRLLLDPDDAVAKAAGQAIAWIGASLGKLQLVRAVNILVASLDHYGKRPGVAAAMRGRLAELTGES